MIVIGKLLSLISLILGIWVAFMLFYQTFLTFFGFKKKTKDYGDHDPESRFLILVPAHNEERVIKDIIENLQTMDYPRELYDFYIIADNCTDHTAELSRSLGANVIETRKERPDSPTGKPIALKKALEAIGNYRDRYDLLMIFDADNLIDKNMFREVNSQYLDKGKPDLIQCYLGCKNKTGVVSWAYYINYTMTNRFFQLSKHRVGRNSSVGGTGFAMTTSYLYERGGWTTRSLTEDLEIQIDATLEGRKVLWNHNVRVYDEKPTTLKGAIRQRIRWGQGHWFVCFHNLIPCVKALFRGKISFWAFLDTIHYLFALSINVVACIQALITGLMFIPGFGDTPNLFGIDIPTALVSIAFFAYSYLFLFYLSDRMDNGIRFKFSTIPMMIAGFFANLIITFIQSIVGLVRFRHQQYWAKTEHKVTRSSSQANMPENEKAS